MASRYIVEFTEDRVGLIETVLTAGLANVVEHVADKVMGEGHGYYCKVIDTECDEWVEVWGANKADAEYNARAKLRDVIADNEQESARNAQIERQQREVARQQALAEENRKRNNTGNDSNENYLLSLLVKIIGIVLLVMAVVWLVSKVLIPLAVINVAVIALIVGLAGKTVRKYVFPVSVAGAAYIIADYNNGWLSHSLVENVSFFQEIIPVFLYLNVVAGLTAAYFLVRDLVNSKYGIPSENSEFSKRNMIIMGSLMLTGIVIIGVQKYADGRGENFASASDAPAANMSGAANSTTPSTAQSAPLTSNVTQSTMMAPPPATQSPENNVAGDATSARDHITSVLKDLEASDKAESPVPARNNYSFPIERYYSSKNLSQQGFDEQFATYFAKAVKHHELALAYDQLVINEVNGGYLAVIQQDYTFSTQKAPDSIRHNATRLNLELDKEFKVHKIWAEKE